ncbi:MAG: chalcone isomerase family protein [Variovorax sp.]
MLGAAVSAAALSLHVDAGASSAAAPVPPELRTALPEAQRSGAARLTYWGFDVYDASLWVAAGFRPGDWPRHAFALQLHYLRAFDGEDIAKRSVNEMRRAGPMTATQSAQWLDAMKAAFPDVKKGDRLLGVYAPGAGVRFFHNGTATGTVRDADFAQRFFGIWLGPQTSEPALREALLASPAR